VTHSHFTSPLHHQRQQLPTILLPAKPLLPPELHRHAAVLLLWCEDNAEPFTLLTKRSEHLALHAGQISLPGGRVDAEDQSLEATALRESYEEIGLDAGCLTTLGRLPDVEVSSGIVVTPIVASCTSLPPLCINPAEVDTLIQLPLAHALQVEAYGHDMLELHGVQRSFRFLRYQEHVIWGATARILLSLAQRLANPAV
jgi:8-oxo-dGTP pyrophosphatase MutT (NUDIX family)